MMTSAGGLCDEEWGSILMAYQLLSRDLRRDRVLDAIVTAFRDVLGCNRVAVWIQTKGGTLSVVADKVIVMNSHIMELEKAKQLHPTTVIASVRASLHAVVLKCSEDFEKANDNYFTHGMDKHLQWVVCCPLMVEEPSATSSKSINNFQGIVYAEKFAASHSSDARSSITPPNLVKKMDLLSKQCAIALFHSIAYETAVKQPPSPTQNTMELAAISGKIHAVSAHGSLVMPEIQPSFPIPVPSGSPSFITPTLPAGTSTSPSMGTDIAEVTTVLAPYVTASAQFDSDEGTTVLSKLSNQGRNKPELEPTAETPLIEAAQLSQKLAPPSLSSPSSSSNQSTALIQAHEPSPIETAAVEALLPKLPIEGGPAAQPTKRRSFPKVQFPQATNPWNVLVIDDDKVNLKIMNNYLTNFHCNASLLDNAIDALKLLGVPADTQHLIPDSAVYGESLASVTQEQLHESNKFDIILCDVMMPEMSGYNFCARLREKYPAHELPVIFLTAKNQVADLVEGFNCGGNDFLTKPVSRMELVSRIKLHVNLAKINKAYSRFVPTTFLNLLGKQDILEVKLGDQIETNMTVMFSDIRSFTTISEKMSPQENFEFINQLLGYLGPTVRENGGFIDKFVGDGIMALFPNSARDGLRAAKEILNRLATINTKRSQENKQPINIGIGLHNGSVMLGCVGEHGRMDGTVIGDVVNLTSRIEDLTKCFGCNILVSHEVVSKLHQEYAPTAHNGKPDENDMAAYDATMKAHPHRYQGTVLVKGRERKVALYEIFHGDPLQVQALKLDTKQEFEHGVLLFEKGTSENNVIDAEKVTKAKLIFEAIANKNSGDNGAQYYVETCSDVLELHQLQMASSTATPSPLPLPSPSTSATSPTARLFRFSQNWRRSNVPPLIPFLGASPGENGNAHENDHINYRSQLQQLSASTSSLPVVSPSAVQSITPSAALSASPLAPKLPPKSVSYDAIVRVGKLPDMELSLPPSESSPPDAKTSTLIVDDTPPAASWTMLVSN